MTFTGKAILPDVHPRITVAGAICLLLSLWGCLAIYNATYHFDSPYGFVGRQLAWIAVGAPALLVASGAPTRFFRRTWPWAAAASYLALILVLIFGIRINGMRGWFSWHGLFCQPSELAKPVYVLCLAGALQYTQPHRSEWLRGYLPLLVLAGVWMVPIALQPDFGAVLIFAMTFVVMYWCMGGPLRHLLATAAAGIPAAVLLVLAHPYLQRRFVAFLYPQEHALDAGWHVLQFRRSLAAGGILGRSWGRGFWSQAYLPLGYSDSVFASTAEVVGFVGILPVIALIVAWAIYGHYRSCRAQSRFAAAAILGITALLTGQAFVHLSVNLGLLPPTGLTLPLVSYGGSSLVSTLLCVGIVEGLCLEQKPSPEPVPAVAGEVAATG